MMPNAIAGGTVNARTGGPITKQLKVPKEAAKIIRAGKRQRRRCLRPISRIRKLNRVAKLLISLTEFMNGLKKSTQGAKTATIRDVVAKTLNKAEDTCCISLSGSIPLVQEIQALKTCFFVIFLKLIIIC